MTEARTTGTQRPKRAYQGRPLPRRSEDVDDQGLAFDITTILDRRRVLGMLGLGAAGLGLAACGDGDTTSSTSSSSTTGSSALTEIPDETAGPYPGDGSNGANVLTVSGVVRSDIRSSFATSTTTAEGIPMTLTLNITDMVEDAPMEGAAVYIWHCNRDGEYSLYSSGIENENYLRGVQVADTNGDVTFTSVFPACYSGRWPHVHFEVYPDVASISDATQAVSTSQLALPQDVCDTVYATTGYEQSAPNLAAVTLASDNVFSDDSASTQLATVTGDTTTGYNVSLKVGVDTSTTPTAGSAPSGGGAPGGSGGAPGGPPPSGAPGGTPPTGMPTMPTDRPASA
ncbi:intradiol ring-cleavage dioxygenase [Kineococcus rubinsiae]|uniref:intradiol ring-cleavage dioxygenase n=1 Tax=Kineococcus rubinsiae TaxID=2609562 RepID=UPI0027E4EC47|nr:intradiol ring-cleavage dioxygenase [Kineococcus rubinsiae]